MENQININNYYYIVTVVCMYNWYQFFLYLCRYIIIININTIIMWRLLLFYCFFHHKNKNVRYILHSMMLLMRINLINETHTNFYCSCFQAIMLLY